jgi:hypothetical protein
MLQKFLNTLGEWVVENGIAVNTGKIKAVRFRELELKIHWLTVLVTKYFLKRAVVNN